MKFKKKDILLIPLIIIFGKLLSFVFNIILGFYFGAGKISDAFIMAHNIPIILYEGISTALISCYIPIYSSLKTESPEKIKSFNCNITTISFLLSVIVTIIYLIFRKNINSYYAHGFDDISLNLLNKYSLIIIWTIPLMGVNSILRAHLQVSEKKSISSLGQVIMYIVLITFIFLFYPNDIAMPWAMLIGNVLFCIVLLFFSVGTGFRWRPYISFKEKYIKSFFVLIAPIFISALASDISSAVDKFFASYYSDGIITSMSYGFQLSFALQGIVSTSILIIVFPDLSEKAALKKYDEMNLIIYKSAKTIFWIILPLVVMGYVLAKPIVNILFGHGKFNDNSVTITAEIFSYYLLGVLPMCIKHICDRVCFSMKKSRIAMITTFIMVAINIILDYILSRKFGYKGLVLATGISIICGTVISLMLIKKEDKFLKIKKLVIEFVKPFAVSIIIGIIIFITHNCFLVRLPYVWNLVGSVIIGIITYGGIYLLVRKKHRQNQGIKNTLSKKEKV